ncbi:putative Acetylornithine aminotransferase, mitochondrial [Cocos nucifera]|uniref:Ornithine aminotransferase n=1 Tax=Cocos nucifera TaxID=13894 RepID=A0A8K0IDC2_COCNU|nr:putative Acetylornithine aminotransferase, mitochondrial [Cocos nucifera]
MADEEVVLLDFWTSPYALRIDASGSLAWRVKAEAQVAAKNEFIAQLKLLEEELAQNPFFGGETFGYMDILFVSFASWFYAYEKSANFSIEDECPRLVTWKKSYHPIPMVFSQGKGACVWDPEGNKYIDFLSAYSAVNQGHCHPKVMKALIEQAERLTLSSRAFYNDKLPTFAEYLTRMFGYDMMLPMNTGAEGVETALKLARKWGYEKKLIPKDEVIIPPNGYLKAVRELCSRYNILMIADEIQTGIARTGKMLACDWEDVRPDVVILGKALGAGVIPVSAVLSDKDVMLCIRPGEHGSTFGGNPLASAVAIAALEVIKDEGLIDRAAKMGQEFRDQLKKVQHQFPQIIKEERGILAKPTHDAIIRLAPPLPISLEELSEASKALNDVFEIDFPKMLKLKPKLEGPPVEQACDRCGRRTSDSNMDN